MPNVACPRCSSSLDIPAELMEAPVRCANCGTVFNPPTLPGAVATVHPADRARPRSRVGCLWGFLGIAILGGFCCCGGCFALVQYIDNPKFEPYEPPDKSYTVSFPGKPNGVNRPGPNGRQVAGADVHRTFPVERFFVEYSALTPVDAMTDKEKLLNEACDRWAGTVPGGKEVKRFLRDVNGFPAMDLFVETGGFQQNNLYVRVIVANGRLYSVGITGQIMTDHTHGDAFLDSFQPVAKGK